MDIIVALTPKNMTVRETARAGDTFATTYVFNGREYTHVGQWPPPPTLPGFHVPIASAEVIETNQDITESLVRFAGPRRIVTPETVRHALGQWSWGVRATLRAGRVGLETYPILNLPEKVPTVRVTNVLGQVSVVFCAK
jgi:hypothetical protein